MKTITRIAIAWALSLAASGRADAAVIHLSGGRSVEGEVLSVDAKGVRIKTTHGEVPIPIERIARPEVDALKKANAALIAGDHAQAKRLAEIVLFWEPANAEAKRILSQSAGAQTEKAERERMAALEKEAAAEAARLQKSAAKMAENPPPDAAAFEKELTGLRDETSKALILYQGTAQAEALKTLLGNVNASLAKLGGAMRQKAEARQKEIETMQKLSLAKATQEQGGADGGAKVRTINKDGSSVDIRRSAVPGAITLIDFYADWCGPCKQLAPQLESYARNNKDVYLRKVDIRDWKSPVAQMYGLNSIPSVWVIDKSGRIAAERLNGMQAVQQAVKAAAR